MKAKQSLTTSFNRAIEGIIYALRTQRNLKIHFFAAVFVLTASLFLRISLLEFIALIFVIALVIITELVNTAVELAIDVTTTSFDPLAKIAKDVAAGAVLTASVTAAILGYLIILRRIFVRLNPSLLTVITRIRHSSFHLTFIGILLVTLLTIIAKALAGETNFFRGGLLSGHSALAFALATAIAFISRSAFVILLAFLIAAITSHSRVESGTHSLGEVVGGALIGILIMVFLFQLFSY